MFVQQIVGFLVVTINQVHMFALFGILFPSYTYTETSLGMPVEIKTETLAQDYYDNAYE